MDLMLEILTFFMLISCNRDFFNYFGNLLAGIGSRSAVGVVCSSSTSESVLLQGVLVGCVIRILSSSSF